MSSKSYDQTPGALNLTMKRGDDFSALVDFSINMTGYTTVASVVSAVDGSTVVPFTVTVPSASNGQVNVALSDAQTAALAAGTYRWQMVWTQGNATRTALAGFVEVL